MTFTDDDLKRLKKKIDKNGWAEFEPSRKKLIEALSIAWAALEISQLNWVEKEKRGIIMSKRNVIKDAMRRIEDLGKSSEDEKLCPEKELTQKQAKVL